MDNYIERTAKEYIKNLASLNLETHSRCNMEREHCDQCPIVKRSEIFGNFRLSIDVMERLFKELNKYGYKGLTGFHHYSEPMMDTRIFDIVKYHVQLCPQAKTQIWSNGRLLTEEKAKRLLDLGLSWIHISAYTDKEYVEYNELLSRLKQKWPNVTYEVLRQSLDARMSIYENTTNNIKRPCPRIEEQLVISSSGDIQLCCNDWMKKNKFGNLYESSLQEAIDNSNFLKVRKDLLTGKRHEYYPCDRCTA